MPSRESSVKGSFFLSRLPEPEKLGEILLSEEQDTIKQKKKSLEDGNAKATTVMLSTESSKRRTSESLLYQTDLQYFSEPEVETSPMASRPSSPVQSDTEFEAAKREEDAAEEDTEQSWEWGQMPTNPVEPNKSRSRHASGGQGSKGDPTTPPSSISPVTQVAEKAESGTGSGWSLWWGGSKTPSKNNPENAVYLDDLKDNEQMMKKFIGSHLYNKNMKSTHSYTQMDRSTVHEDDIDDMESGNGPSLPLSPRSVEAVPRPPNSAAASKRDLALKGSSLHCIDIEFSLCGGLDEPSTFTRSVHAFKIDS